MTKLLLSVTATVLLAATATVLLAACPVFAESPICGGSKDICQKVVDISKDWDKMVNNKDATLIRKLVTPDIVFMFEGAAVSGAQDAEKLYADGIKAGWKDHVGEVREVHVVGDVVWSTGSWSATNPDGHKVGGTWGDVLVKNGDALQVRMLTSNLDEQKYNTTAAK